MPRNPAQTAVVTVSLPVSMAHQIERGREAVHRSRSEVVCEALRYYFRAQPDIGQTRKPPSRHLQRRRPPRRSWRRLPRPNRGRRIHQTLRAKPAMEAKVIGPDGKEKAVTDHAWTRIESFSGGGT